MRTEREEREMRGSLVVIEVAIAAGALDEDTPKLEREDIAGLRDTRLRWRGFAGPVGAGDFCEGGWRAFVDMNI